jgi:hypothetical protein
VLYGLVSLSISVRYFVGCGRRVKTRLSSPREREERESYIKGENEVWALSVIAQGINPSYILIPPYIVSPRLLHVAAPFQ